jgi:hypothetical protein
MCMPVIKGKTRQNKYVIRDSFGYANFVSFNLGPVYMGLVLHIEEIARTLSLIVKQFHSKQ